MHCTIWKGGVGTALWGAVGLNHLKEELSHLWRLDHLRGGGVQTTALLGVIQGLNQI